MDKFYTCKNDHCFKSTFIDNHDITLLKDLLECVLKIKLNKIKIINGEQSSDNVNLKSSLLDSLMEIGRIRLGIELNSKVNKYMYFKNTNYLFYDVSHNFRIGRQIDDSKIFIQINFTYGF